MESVIRLPAGLWYQPVRRGVNRWAGLASDTLEGPTGPDHRERAEHHVSSAPRDRRPATAPRLAVVGVHGHGRAHLRNAVRLHCAGRVELVAVVDPRPLSVADVQALADDLRDSGSVPRDAAVGALRLPWYGDLGSLLGSDVGAATVPDVVVLATPIHTHAPLAEQALRAGCDVLLEKPPTASLHEYRRLLEVVADTGRAVQVGFQTFGSTTLAQIHRLVADGEIGEMRGVGATGAWVRSTDYWDRSPWTGRRTFAGRPVVDGVTTNALAHAVATALHLAGATAVDDVVGVELDQYRANEIEVDDTTAVRITTSGGTVVSAGLTLCAREHATPLITVQGTAGTAVLDYYADTVTVTGRDGSRTTHGDRTDLLTNLLDHRQDPSVPLLCALRDTGAFMRVLDSVRAAPDPVRIDPAQVERVVDEAGTHLVVRGVADWCARVATEHATFAELGAPWARHSDAAGRRP